MIRNILFHRVSPQRDKLWDPMDVALFDRCIKYISNHYEVVLLEDIYQANLLNSNASYATLMFDDGYKNNIEFAADILHKYKCQASFYVVTECIDKNIPTWTHKLDHAFMNSNNHTLILNYDFLPDKLKINKPLSSEDKLPYIKKLKPFLKSLSHERRNEVLNKFYELYSDVKIPDIMMNWDDLKALKNAGHYIGSHSDTHCMFGTMSNEDQILNELKVSGTKIQNNLGHFPLTISYPVGSYNQTTIKLCKEAGYQLGLAVKQTIYNPGKDDLFEIPRIELYNEAWWKTKLRITNVLENIKTFIGYK